MYALSIKYLEIRLSITTLDNTHIIITWFHLGTDQHSNRLPLTQWTVDVVIQADIIMYVCTYVWCMYVCVCDVYGCFSKEMIDMIQQLHNLLHKYTYTHTDTHIQTHTHKLWSLDPHLFWRTGPSQCSAQVWRSPACSLLTPYTSCGLTLLQNDLDLHGEPNALCVSVCECVWVCVSVCYVLCMCMRIRWWKDVNNYCTHTHTRRHTHTYTHAHTHTHTQHTHTHTLTHTLTHTYLDERTDSGPSCTFHLRSWT